MLVSIFSVTSFAADCKVSDSDISSEYAGGCVNGLAHGKGRAKGGDTYEGEFKLGNKHGNGTYAYANGDKYEGNYLDDRRNGKGVFIWKDGSRHVGEFRNSQRSGFGKFSMTKDSEFIKSWANANQGKWQGNIYVVEGMFEDGRLVLSCTSPQNCKQEQTNREAQERREAADRERDKATACNKYYNGYVGYVDYNNGKRDFWGQDIGNKYGRFVVLGSGGGSVSIKGVDGGSYPGYDKMDNVSCTWLREKER